MKNKTVYRIVIIIIVFLLIAACYAASRPVKPQGTYISYADFNTMLEEGKIGSVTLRDGSVSFTVPGSAEQFYTDDPGTEDFKERLLLQGVEVTDSKGENSDIYSILDMAFNVVFIIFLAAAAYKVMGSLMGSFKVVRHTDVHFSDIAGMNDLKKEMMRSVDVLKNPQYYRNQGIRPNKGIVLEGPPGNGKTLFAKALAEEAGVNFIPTKGADFQSALMSVGPSKIRQLFRKARRHKPCIIFIDEFDGIGERRNYAGSGIDKENNRIITAMLNEMDGFENEDGVLVVAATNSYESLDAALIRPGRFDLKYTIPNPDRDTIFELMELYSADKDYSQDIDADELADLFEGLSCSAIETILNEASVVMISEGKDVIDRQCIAKAFKKTGLYTHTKQ